VRKTDFQKRVSNWVLASVKVEGPHFIRGKKRKWGAPSESWSFVDREIVTLKSAGCRNREPKKGAARRKIVGKKFLKKTPPRVVSFKKR